MIEALFDNLPDEIKTYRHWVCAGKGKVPITPTGTPAAVNDSRTWVTFEEAANRHPPSLGLVFTTSDPFCGIDLDHCRDPITHQIEPWAWEIIQQLNSYTELSVSGTGVHILCRAQLPGSGGKRGHLEMYDHGRYFIMTGEHLGGTPTTIEERGERVAALYHAHWGTARPVGATGEALTDGEVLKIQGALRTIPANDYQVWLHVGMALHQAEASPRSYELWRQWSVTCPEKYEEQACQQKWRSFTPRMIGVSLSTLYWYAYQRGWTNGNGKPEVSFTRDGREDPPEFEADLTIMRDVTVEPVNWLWYPYLPLRKLCLLGGDAGLGKTWVALNMAAALSRGRWPFGPTDCPSLQEPANTLYFYSEDGAGDTIKPRALSMGADQDHIIFFNGKRDRKGRLLRATLDEEDFLATTILSCRAKLIIFDPFQRFLPSKTKMNEMETVAPVVSALMRIAEQSNSTILLLGHLNKSRQETMGYKFIGSVDWYAAARSAMMVVEDKENPACGRYFFQIKNSLAPIQGGVAYTLDPQRIDAPFMWGDRTDVSAREMANGEGNKKSRAEAAAEFLHHALQNGEVLSDDIFARGREAGFSRNAIFEAKDKLGVRSRKKDYSGKWVMSLPE